MCDLLALRQRLWLPPSHVLPVHVKYGCQRDLMLVKHVSFSMIQVKVSRRRGVDGGGGELL